METPDETIAISKFKATCLAVLERVRVTGKRIVVTRFGEPVAEIGPPTPPKREPDWLGVMSERGSIRGDLIAPVVDPAEWEVIEE